MRWKPLICAAAVACGIASPYAAGATEVYPGKPIRLIVPWPPGGGTDIFARAIGQKLTEAWGEQVIVDNRPGAAGNIGADIAAKALADGYTLLIATITLATNPSMYKSMSFDVEKDFDPITLVAGVPHLLVVNPSLTVKSVEDLIALAKTRPDRLNYASAGIGSPFHLAAELFKLLASVKINHVPYKGGGPAVLDVIAGQVQLTFANLVAVLPHVHAGKLRGLAVTSAERSPAAPEFPTIAEAGLKGYDFTSWFGMLAPAGTPKSVIQKLNREIVKALLTPELKSRLSRDGADVIASTPEEFRNYIASETVKWTKVIKDAGITAE
jgi:tripartite-type tricarboxylate transporter receptor subunit TctC